MLFQYYLMAVFLLSPGSAPLPLEAAKDKIECETALRRAAKNEDVKDFLSRPDVQAAGGALACLKIELPSA
jgi:hypothetical protein